MEVTGGKRGLRRSWRDVVGLGSVGVIGIVMLLPTLVHGWSIGAYHLLGLYGVLQRPILQPHGYQQASDQFLLFIPWKSLAWTQVHHGALPLWNQYSALGMPLAFNWESAPFSVQALVGYLLPLHLVLTSSILCSFVIAGAGAYVLARVLGLSSVGAAMAGVVFELSGPFVAYASWQDTAVLCWAGWLFAETILIMRGRKRLRHVAGFAVIVALAGYGGQPEALFLLAAFLVVFLLVVFVVKAFRGYARSMLRPVRDLVCAGVAGGALMAPLALPALQLSALSVRRRFEPSDNVSAIAALSRGKNLAQAFSAHDLTHLIFSTFDGLPVAGGHFFADRPAYIDSVALVGLIALALVVVAVVVRWRDPIVLGFAVATVALGSLVFFQPVLSLVDHLPSVGSFLWNRAVLPMTFGVAVQAGYGADLLARRSRDRAVVWAITVTSVVAAVSLGALWLFGRGTLPPAEAAERARSFLWPAAAVALLLVVAGVLVIAQASPRRVADRRGRLGPLAAVSLLVCEGAFLFSAGAPLWTSSKRFLPTTPALVTLQRTVGGSLVGFGSRDCVFPPALGLRENVNVAYKVRELAVYDPMTPLDYFTAWTSATGEPAGYLAPNLYCPAVNSAVMARRYGVRFILTSAYGPAPTGATFVTKVGTEKLFRVPGASLATVSVLRPDGNFPALDAPGAAVHVTGDDAGTYRMRTHTGAASVLRLRIADVPGWHATVDGKPLALKRYAGIMLQARISAGRHLVEVHYWPTDFTVGLVLAGCSAGGLLGAGLWVRLVRRRTGEPRSAPEVSRPA